MNSMSEMLDEMYESGSYKDEINLIINNMKTIKDKTLDKINSIFEDKFKEKGGFFDLPSVSKVCISLEHNPPSHLYIPPGKGYKHICPMCGKETILIPPQISL